MLRNATIEHQESSSVSDKLRGKTSVSTQFKTSGKVQAKFSSVRPNNTTSGRSTKNSIKALRPLTPTGANSDEIVNNKYNNKNVENSVLSSSLSSDLCHDEYCISATSSSKQKETVIVPPTHPRQLSPDYNLPIFPFPTISQLRDYPNLSVPGSYGHKSVIVTLPSSAPATPTHTRPFLNTQPGSPVTPGGDREGIGQSLTLGRRELPSSAPFFSTPAESVKAGSWDNFFEIPTYIGQDQDFWSTRKIQLVSTDISDPEDPLLINTSDISLDSLDKGQVFHSLDSELNTLADISSNMSAKNKTESDLENKGLAVLDMCSDLAPERITLESAPSMQNELESISNARNIYRNGVRQFLKQFSEELSEE